jgi:hypothetical protein
MKPPVRQRRCPWCRRVVLIDEANAKTSHEAPVCAGYDALMRSASPPSREIGPEVLEFDGPDEPSSVS